MQGFSKDSSIMTPKPQVFTSSSGESSGESRPGRAEDGVRVPIPCERCADFLDGFSGGGAVAWQFILHLLLFVFLL